MTWAALTGYCPPEAGTIIYNTGVPFFFVNGRSRSFDLWERLSSGPHSSNYGPRSVRAGRGAGRRLSFVLPANWNFTELHPLIVGSVRIWRSKSDPPVGIGDLGEIRVFQTEKMPFANRRRPLRLAWRLVRQSGSLRRSGKY